MRNEETILRIRADLESLAESDLEAAAMSPVLKPRMGVADSLAVDSRSAARITLFFKREMARHCLPLASRENAARQIPNS